MDVSTLTTSTMETNLDSPTSLRPPLGRFSSSTLSMRAKAERKRKAGALHNSNFRAGFIPVTEETLQRTGIRGRKRYFLYCTLATMLIVVILNALVTAWLITVLGLTHRGIYSIEVSTFGVRPILRILHKANIISITMDRAPLGARYNLSLDIIAKEYPLQIHSVSESSKTASSVSLEGSNITLTTDDLFIQSAKSNTRISANLEFIASYFGVSNFFAEALTVRKIHSRKGMQDLYLESAKREVDINGTKGIVVQSDRDVEFYARSIRMQSMGNMIMSAKHNVYLSTDLPSTGKTVQRRRTSEPAVVVHKVCVCGGGKIFLSPDIGTGASCKIGKRLAKVLCAM